MTGVTVNPFFKICWLYLTPLMCLVGPAFLARGLFKCCIVQSIVQSLLVSALCSQGAFISSLVWYTPLVYNHWYIYPTWAIVLGWILALSSILLVPGFAVYMLVTSTGSLKQVGEPNIQLSILINGRLFEKETR